MTKRLIAATIVAAVITTTVVLAISPGPLASFAIGLATGLACTMVAIAA